MDEAEAGRNTPRRWGTAFVVLGSVVALLTSPLATGLFSQAMVMSGGGRMPLVTRPLTGGTEAAPSADQTDAA